jgi:hypothetical protein
MIRNLTTPSTQRAFRELFGNAPHALRIAPINRLCQHNSLLIGELLFARTLCWTFSVQAYRESRY